MVGKKMFLKLFVLALAVSFFAPVIGAAEAAPASEILSYNGNDYAVLSGPPNYPAFVANKTLVVTSITTYHYHGNGGAPGTIELVDANGKSYGKWRATGREGSGVRNAYWDVNVNVVLPAGGTYTVKDSNLATWSYNEQSNRAGFAWVMGYVRGEGQQPTPITPTPPIPPNPPTPTAGQGSEWVFAGTIRNDKEWQKQVAESNNDPNYRTSVSVSPNEATHTLTYVNKYTMGTDFPGATATAVLTWTNPPSVIKPNQEFSLQLSFKLTNCTANCSSSGHEFGGWGVGADIIPCDENGNPAVATGFTHGNHLNSKDGKRAGKEKMTAGVSVGMVLPATVYGKLGVGNKKGERISVRVTASSNWVHVVTHYIYEWR